MIAQPLLVPVETHAMVVNDRNNHGVPVRVPFRRWQLSFYGNLDEHRFPEPPPYETDLFESVSDNGVYLKWTLPEGLRGGRQDPHDGSLSLPLVPNRWLVVRHERPIGQSEATPVVNGWVVDSDFLDEEGERATTPSLDPDAPPGAPVPVWIGRRVELTAKKYQEDPQRREMYLTATGPGVPDFHAFQPYNANVFSIHDRLTGVADKAMLDYLVVGWYSDATKDPLAGDGTITDLLARWGWRVPDPSQVGTRSLYAGTALAIRWELGGPTPESDYPAPGTKLDVGVGHSTADALDALNAPLVADDATSHLLSTLRYDLLETADSDPGKVPLDKHATWFGQTPGGCVWEMVDRPDLSDKVPPMTEADWELERQCLAELNNDQQRFETVSRRLRSARRHLFDLWWLRGLPDEERPAGPADFDEPCEVELNPDNQGSTANTIRDALRVLRGHEGQQGLLDRIPHGETAADLAASIAAYLTDKKLRADRRTLKQKPRPSFRGSIDPAIALHGIGGRPALPREDPLPCRTLDDLVNSVSVDGKPRYAKTAPAPNLEGLPERSTLTRLLDEWALLAVAAKLPAVDQGSYDNALAEDLANPDELIEGTPAEYTTPWRQPWLPLYLLWRINSYPLPYHSNRTPNWSFDGTRYRWKGSGGVTAPDVLLGRSALTPLPAFLLRGRIKQYAHNHPEIPRSAVRGLLDTVTGWDQVAQTLNGVNQWIQQRCPAVDLAPQDGGNKNGGGDEDLADLVGPNHPEGVPDPGPSPPDQFDRFWPVRSLQFTFSAITVVDAFGRSLDVVSPGTGGNEFQFAPRRAASVTPEDGKTILTDRPYRCVELPPRILTDARLRFDFVAATNDSVVTDEPQTDATVPRPDDNPVCGWLMVNHFTRSLTVHAPDGTGLGELEVTLDPDTPVAWIALPDAPFEQITDPRFAADYLHLASFVRQLAAKGKSAFEDLLTCLDQGMTGIEPPPDDDKNLAILVGQPLALLRARVQFELDGRPATDPGWPEILGQPRPDFLDRTWNVRLGAATMLGDGLLGFFSASDAQPSTSTDYTHLHTEHVPNTTTSDYLRSTTGNEIALPVAAPGDPGDKPGPAAYVTLIADPWTAVHAVTDILPVTKLRLGEDRVRGPLERVRFAFRMDPVLAAARLVPVKEPVAAAGEPEPGEIMRLGTERDSEPTVEQIALPRPASWKGVWDWVERARSGAWTARPIAADGAARPDAPPPVARSGFLRLSRSVTEPDPPEGSSR